jgi:Uma2 family endonuclease
MIFYTRQQYLEIERKAEFKSEFLNGEMYAMSGASRNHNLIADRFHVEVHSRQQTDNWLLWETNDEGEAIDLESVGCRLKMSDVYAKVRFESAEQADA